MKDRTKQRNLFEKQLSFNFNQNSKEQLMFVNNSNIIKLEAKIISINKFNEESRKNLTREIILNTKSF